MSTADGPAYACSVVNTLLGDFPDLNDPVVAGIVLKAVHAHAQTGDALEVIVDDPFSANWRLVRAPHDRRRVHLACWRVNRNDAGCERWARLNTALDALALNSEGG